LSWTRYNVEVNPVPPGRKLRRILQILFEQPEFTGVATDFKTLIISRSPLDIPEDYQISIAYRAEGDDGPTPNAPRFTVRVVSPTPMPVYCFLPSNLVPLVSNMARHRGQRI
jgi:hypothetical protein